jgi:hypothetical protein
MNEDHRHAPSAPSVFRNHETNEGLSTAPRSGERAQDISDTAVSQEPNHSVTQSEQGDASYALRAPQGSDSVRANALCEERN